MKRWMEDYFNFSRRDRIAIWVLVLLIFLTLLLPHFFSNAIHTPPGENDTAWIALVRALEIKQDSMHLVQSRQKRYEPKTFSSRYADTGWKWKNRTFPVQKDSNFPVRRFSKRRLSPIDINLADSTAFIALPGIGSRLADRIIRFRDKLGGFYAIDQIAEVYGLADSVFQKIKPLLESGPYEIRKINVNTATFEELKAHPYIRYAIANSIVQYRNQHGKFSTLEDLKKIILISEDIFKKISPYLYLD